MGKKKGETGTNYDLFKGKEEEVRGLPEIVEVKRREIRTTYDLFKLKEEEIKGEDGSVEEKKRYITGYAILFNSFSTEISDWFGDTKFREIILPEAVDSNLISSSDILMLVNHNRNSGLLARSKNGYGSLKINIDEKGVYFEFEVPNTQAGNDTYESIKRGDMTQTSFSFSVAENGEQILEENGECTRTIKKIDKIYDFSIVDFPAYSETYAEIAQRSLNEYRNKLKEKKEEKKSVLLTKRDVKLRMIKNSLKIKMNLR